MKFTIYSAPFEAENVKHVYHQYTIKVPAKRNELKEFLAKKGISSMIYYPVSNHLQEVYKDLGWKKGDLPISEELQEKVLSLPIYPDLSKENVDLIVEALKEFQSTIKQ